MPAALRICFLLNPTSGTNRRLDLPALLSQHLDANLVSYEVEETQYAGHAVELARAAAARGCRVVVAVGGDGTVNEVARGLLGTQAALGILPRGSGNGLARHLKVPMEIVAAIKHLNQPTFQRIDVGSINGREFFCTAGLGFDAHVSKCFAEAGTRGLATYAQVALREYRRFRPVPITVALADTTLETDCYVLAFANAAQYGNNAYIAPRADIQDGLLDLCLIDSMSVVRAVRVALSLALGDLPESGAAVFHTARQVQVEAARPLGFHVDGDYVGTSTHFSVELHPLALEVAV
ncbi:diacylglycerol kinase family lipid kinase [Hymenobacter lutimineralis]|uniref:Diacylglycerol kinase family lipid kinase n=1 Tax=Hymenobacter lutimineralis TaxID=2606448 RepID=A0A5D6VH97_9BACT|nr:MULTISPECIES: diacylglycerol kinase family protein [Hymenobacter]QIX60094.1 diacylglycerol kinase family lipid kinase [Hymenobacter sp. BT18]TYZ14472.1 diacylglycerol kinase family lipid kinase [Hymenobacter lutimineralis]